jgi:hypothetical protein
MMERGADRLPSLLLAKAEVRLDGFGRRLAQVRQAKANTLDDGRADRPCLLDTPVDDVGGLRGILASKRHRMT